MTEPGRCPQCGTELPPDAPEGLCPKCVLQVGLGSQAPSRPGAETTPYPGAATAPAPADIAQYFPDLEVLELLGQGGMGAVYKARQKQLDRLVALKILPPQVSSDPAFAERFNREAKALARLHHPNVVTVHELGQKGGLYYFIMEYVDGVNLRQMIHAGHLNPEQALAIVPRICEALQYAHEEGIVHRDIKPENILIDKKGRVKIADFGLAKLFGKAPAATLTGAGQIMGTPHYMAPEQIERPLQVDHRADIYSLGVVFYEMLTGELPIGRFAPPSQKVQVDVRLDDVVLRALEKEPERRYQKVSDVKTHVESICGLSPLVLQRFGYEYRSKTTLFGLPLIHIATGIDPRTGRKRVAKGIIAMGDVAVGFLALGGGAFGGIAIGGVAVGLVTLGGLSIALLLAVGGAALGSVAFGGGAVGGIAVGGMAVGYFAYGGGAYGVHALGGNVRDPVAVEFFSTWADQWLDAVVILALAMPVFFLLLGTAVALLRWRQHAKAMQPARAAGDASTGRVFGLAGDLAPSGTPPEGVPVWSAPAERDPVLHGSALRQQVRGPAIGLVVTALVNWIGMFVAIGILFLVYGVPEPDTANWLAGLVLTLFFILALGSALILFGALKMMRLESYGWALFSTILAMIIGPGYLIGWPIGIWSVAVLTRPEVKRAFAARQQLLA